MSKYFFEAITPAAALAYDPAVDSLGFFSSSISLSALSLAFNANGTVSLTFEDQTVVFGPRFTGDVRLEAAGGMFVGTSGADVLPAGRDVSAAFAGPGDDTLTSGEGVQLLDGGAGSDTLVFSAATTVGIVVDLANSRASLVTQPNIQDTLRGVENATGTAFGDRLTGDAGGNVLRGLAGADTLQGLDGADTLDGGAGGDTMDAGAGDDLIVVTDADAVTGGAGADTYQFVAGGAPITGDVSAVARISGFASEDRLSFAGPAASTANFAAVVAAGYADGLQQARALADQGSVQYVAAQVGGSTFVFAPGAESVVHLVNATGVTAAQIVGTGAGGGTGGGGGGGSNPAAYAGGPGADTIVGDKGPGTLTGGAGDDRLVGVSAGPFDLQGGAGDDVLIGSFGGDSLNGGDGRDTLEGGFFPDRLTGGAGADVFVAAVGHANNDRILDWSPEDRLVFAYGEVAGATYLEATETPGNSATSIAGQAIGSGQANIVVVQVGPDLHVFVDSKNDNAPAGGAAGDDVLFISGRTLADIDITNFVTQTTSGLALPPAPAATLPAGATGSVGGNMDLFQVGSFQGALISQATPIALSLGGQNGSLSLQGQGFAYDGNDQILGGTVSRIVVQGGVLQVNLGTQNLSAVPFGRWVQTNATAEAFSTILAGNDQLQGSDGGDLLRGLDGADVIEGAGGQDSLFGGQGSDVIFATRRLDGLSSATGRTYLRGEEGDDYILGARDFDDIHGNQGNDTASGGLGDDWVVGGKENDLLFGDAGNDLVYGNIGADTCLGGSGGDIVRGGQDNDQVFGDAGDDYVSGDKGDDTMTGGAGADIFHSFGDAGIDRVIDFRLGDGDRVLLDPGTTYTVAQSGADTIISMTGGGQMILVGVSMSSLAGNWITVG